MFTQFNTRLPKLSKFSCIFKGKLSLHLLSTVYPIPFIDTNKDWLLQYNKGSNRKLVEKKSINFNKKLSESSVINYYIFMLFTVIMEDIDYANCFLADLC